MSIQISQRRGLVVQNSVMCILILGLAVGLFIHFTPDPQTCTRSFITNVARCHPTQPNERDTTTIVFTLDY